MTGTLLRERVRGRHAPVTYIELFFDLVFVFAITRISHHLLEHLNWAGAAQAGALLLAVWLAWNYTAWITNWLDPEHPAVRIAIFAMMGAGLVMSTSIPDAFQGRGAAFVGGFLALQLGRTLFILFATRRDPSLRRNFVRVLVWTIVSGVFWVAGAALHGSERLALWAFALGLDYLAPAIGFWVPGLSRTATGEWTIEGGHMAERCGLFIMICLGESILVTGATFGAQPWTAAVCAAFAVALLGSVATWWIYYSVHAGAAMDAISRAEDPGRMGVRAYTYGHILLVAGVVVGAAGDELVLAHPHEQASLATALLVVAGPALFLLGALVFKHSVFGVWAPPRVVGLVLLLSLLPAAQSVSTLSLAALAVGVLGLVAIWETLLSPAPVRDARPG